MDKRQEKPNGIKCPKCQCQRFRVRDTDRVAGAIRRYRKCLECGYIVTTFEKLVGK